jgi:SNF2 family DNA or RNA helicase
MIANQAAGGIGVNMVAASYSIYYSKNFSYGDDAQSESRNHRGGSERHEKITRIDLVCPQTIDELVNEALKAKKNIGELILEWKV